MTTLDNGFSDDEFSDDDGIKEMNLDEINGTDEKSMPASPKASTSMMSKSGLSASNASSSTSSPDASITTSMSTSTSTNNNKEKSKSGTSDSGTSDSGTSDSGTSKSGTSNDAGSDNEEETEKSGDDNFFTAMPTTTEAVTFDELYNTESREELVDGMKKSDLVKPAIKILVVGVSPEYIKFEPTRDVFGFLMSKDQKERSSMYQTNTCTAAIQHVNVPSLNTKLTVDENKIQDIFAAAVAEDAASIMQKLKSDGLVTLDGDQNTTVSIAPSTPYLEMLFTESKEDGGMIHILTGDKMTTAFNFMKCKSLLVDDTTPKKVYLSSILNTLADSGAENIAIVNLSSSSENSTNKMSLGPSNEPTASEDEDTTSDEEGDEDTTTDEEEKSTSAPVLESETDSEDEASPTLKVENNNENSDEETSNEDNSDEEGPSPTPIKLGADNNLKDEDVTVVEPSKSATPAVPPQGGGKKTKKNKMKLKLKPILKKTRSKK